MPDLILVVHNVRSAHNVGSLLRTADGLGVKSVYLTGYTPYPLSAEDQRLPHIARRIHNQIQKTALGAEETVKWIHYENLDNCLRDLMRSGYAIAALEQTPGAIGLHDFKPPQKTALIVGNEVEGLDKDTLNKTGIHLEIPMRGQKESFNVAIAAAIALYELAKGLDKRGA